MSKKFNALQITNWFRVENFQRMKRNPNVDPVTQMKVMKLLYYVQGICLAIYNYPAFTDPILAWKFGPVVYSVHEKYKGDRELPIVKKGDYIDEISFKDFDLIQNTNDVSDVVNSVDIKLGDFTASRLMMLTHHEDPWLKTEQNHIITQKSMKNYFIRHIVNKLD